MTTGQRLSPRAIKGDAAHDNYVLTTVGGVPAWMPAASETLPVTIFDAKGDLIVGTAADAAARLGVGTDGQVLTADAASAGGMKWAAGGGGGGSGWDHPVTLALSTLTGWTAGAGSWSITSGVIRQATTTNNVYRLRYSTARLDLAEVVVEVDIKIDTAPNTTSSRGGLVFGAPWGSDGSGGLLCALAVNTSGFVTGVNWEYDGITAGPTVTLASNIALGTWITFRAHKVGSDVAAYVNGTYVGTGVIDQPNREQGSLTLYAYAADASFRNLDVWTPTLP